MRVCQTNVARCDQVVCWFLEIKETFSGLCFRLHAFVWICSHS